VPLAFHIDPSRRLVQVRASGVITDEDVDAHVREVAAHPAFEATYDQVIDIDRGVALKVGLGAIQRSAEADPFAPHARRAFVARGPLAYGLVRMWMGFTRVSADRVGLFQRPEEALAWLAEP
jgi:hypothetical protein